MSVAWSEICGIRCALGGLCVCALLLCVSYPLFRLLVLSEELFVVFSVVYDLWCAASSLTPLVVL